ncbi:alpha/beta fold hydrolase [Agromyces sp. ISL-38]|uniref:alpha/beta hydrolase family protein n=1 Tax=Agromyces sp. ISL-38 TaxID=2819107 RepID=UPI0027E04D86|nr:alpha/beta fold hydrolase [Agromyces sp. ISL-38]
MRAVDRMRERPVVILDRTSQTATPGLFNLILENGGWVQLGVAVHDVAGGRVGRDVVSESAPGLLASGVRASWSGIYFQTPKDAGLEAVDVEVPTAVGPAPAWLIGPQRTSSNTWAIHIHGLGSSRAGTLRGVQVAAAARLTSLVVTYRNDGEGPVVGAGRSTLGSMETNDVEAAVRFASERGARRFILFGWSMGATIALQLAARPDVRDQIVGLVLESPVLDWVETIKANCTRSGLPRWVGALAVPWLDSPGLARLVGLESRVMTHRFDWIARAGELSVPTLVLHGEFDTSAPVNVVKRLSGLVPDAVRVEAFEADHTMTWNVDRDRWEALIAERLRRMSAPV